MQTVRVGSLELGKGQPCIIVPLTSSALPDLLLEARDLASLPVDMAEWRVDMFGSGPVQEHEVLGALEQLKAVLPVPLLVTFRTCAEGGNRPLSPEAYASLCTALCRSRLPDLMDVEAFTDIRRAASLVALAHDCGIPVVASSHDFSATPPENEIVRRLLSMQNDLDADVLKIAVMPASRADVLTLLSATQKACDLVSRPVITMSMGPLGVISRVCGQSFGSAATFGAARAASAPGQMNVRDLHAVLAALQAAGAGSVE